MAKSGCSFEQPRFVPVARSPAGRSLRLCCQRSLEDSVCVRDANTSDITKRLAINSAGCPGSTPRFDHLVSFVAFG